MMYMALPSVCGLASMSAQGGSCEVLGYARMLPYDNAMCCCLPGRPGLRSLRDFQDPGSIAKQSRIKCACIRRMACMGCLRRCMERGSCSTDLPQACNMEGRVFLPARVKASNQGHTFRLSRNQEQRSKPRTPALTWRRTCECT